MRGQERAESRRAANARKRISRRPSRLGIPAGTQKPDHAFDPDAGFPALLKDTWRRAEQAAGLRSFVEVLLTLDGHVPADVQLRALGTAQEAALQALCALSWREENTPAPTPAPGEGREAAFLGEIGLSTGGRIRVRVPGDEPLDRHELVGGARQVPWTARTLQTYQELLRHAAEREDRSAADCRTWLHQQGEEGRQELLEQAKEAALRTAPFVLYQQDKLYTNFRGPNNLTGKTLWPGHPDCTLSDLQQRPLDLWSDSEVQLLVCLTLLIRSAGPGRVEEANGTQLTVGHVAHMLERIRRGYNSVLGGETIAPAASQDIRALDALAVSLRAHRPATQRGAQLYREIHGALMHKIERVAAAPGQRARAREDAVRTRLSERLPLAGTTLAELGDHLAASPHWLADPHGDFETGLESLVHETVAATTEAFEADFTMSRGMRSLPELISALREERWAEICDWDITRFFCCVVPDPRAARHFGGSPAALADAAWAMSSRMQYNSWHFIAGNLPREPEVRDRDHFVPPTIPDISFHSDQHHHGHVNNNVRFALRTPQTVEVDGHRFHGFMDLRLLRCAGEPFDEQDLLAAHRVSAFVARATTLVAAMAAAGRPVEVTAFDSPWHWSAIAGGTDATAAGQVRRAS
ncbi:hypothetical protein ACFZAE_38440 [Streptomyces scabiei]|uniref:hypothetical protein n=1 Tax=Streptomyces scabiei TaxID=1930 RepID=UPI0036E29CFC